MIVIRQYWRMGLLALLVGVIALTLIVSQAAQVERLVYAVSDNAGTSLVLYDPGTGARTTLLHDDAWVAFSFGPDGRLAFSRTDEDDVDIYVLDTQHLDHLPINVMQAAATDEYPLAWSPDGRSLAFESSDGRGRRAIYVWDGITVKDITPEDDGNIPIRYEVAWGADGRLAFTIWFGYYSGDKPSEVFLWDGHTTMNLSQNPLAADYSASWNRDGRLAMLSEWDGDYDIFVWDGLSFKDGLPDRDTFANIAPELTGSLSHPGWTSDGRLVFGGVGPQDRYLQVYVWDGQTTTNISQNPEGPNLDPTWSTDGRWAMWSARGIRVRDAENRLLLTTHGQARPAWSADGYLMLCRRGPQWTLFLWDRQPLVEVVRGQEIYAQWQSGATAVCSSG